MFAVLDETFGRMLGNWKEEVSYKRKSSTFTQSPIELHSSSHRGATSDTDMYCGTASGSQSLARQEDGN